MLQVSNLHKQYKNTVALNGVNISVDRGETVVLMGPSGCGKSTLIRCINRLAEADGGDVRFDGQLVNEMSDDELYAYRRRIGFVFQHFNLIGRLSVLDNVALPLVMAGVAQKQAREDAALALAKVGLGADVLKRLPEALSGGQRQRVGIARALVGEPDLMLWDEPTASLDPILVQEVLEVMENLARSSQAGMLIVTHELSFAMRVADRIVLMEKGRIVEEGYPKAIFAAPQSSLGLRYKKLWQARYSADHSETGALAGIGIGTAKKQAAGMLS